MGEKAEIISKFYLSLLQIVRDLAGYTMGRSDLVRRAMSKKKVDVMEKERKNFVYGNTEENVKGCINNGISEEVANHIFDEMIDFANYAFNKSHAACYAVISYQTAYLKCYYPAEFMASLLTSVLGNTAKISEYIQNCRQMGIEILPPDINEAESSYSASGNTIRYGLSSVKSLGKTVIDTIINERNKNGKFKNLRDFIERFSSKEVNKRTIESFIKSGSFDSFGISRKQLMNDYVKILENYLKEKKREITGQMNLFDLLPPEDKSQYEEKFEDVGEYTKEEMLAYEKEVLGIYISGHPLDDYKDLIEKNVTAKTIDFKLDDETKKTKVKDQLEYIVGGIISSKTIKFARNNKNMAFITLEDLYGSVDVVVFSNQYEKYADILNEDTKVFIIGRASVTDERAKLIASKIILFDSLPKVLWIQFEKREEFLTKKFELCNILEKFKGISPVNIYFKDVKKVEKLDKNFYINPKKDLIVQLEQKFLKENVKLVEKTIENM